MRAEPARALNTTVTGALGDLDGDGDGGAREAAVVQAAAACWDARVTTNRNFALTVNAGALTGATIGQGSVSAVNGTGIPTSGTLTMDNDGSTNYFVDATPTTSTEFTADDGNSAWRLLGGPGGGDLFSLVTHEIGHALAWICGASCGFNNPNYDGLMNPAPNPDTTASPSTSHSGDSSASTTKRGEPQTRNATT